MWMICILPPGQHIVHPRRNRGVRTQLGRDPPHPHTSELINLNDLNCNEESSVLRAFSELLHLINSNPRGAPRCAARRGSGGVKSTARRRSQKCDSVGECH